MKPKTIIIDVDGCLANIHSPWIARYNKDWDDNFRVCDIKGWDIHTYVKPECAKRIYEYIADPTLYDDAKPVRGCKRAIKFLRDSGFHITFLTSTAKGTEGRKRAWLLDNGIMRGFEDDYIETSDSKDGYEADFFVDDYPKNLENFNGKRILFHRAWNADYPGFRGWAKVVEYIQHIQSDSRENFL